METFLNHPATNFMMVGYVLLQLVPELQMILPKLGNSDLFMARIKGDEDASYF